MVESAACKKYVIFGATGNVGLELVKQGLAQGLCITAYGRNPDKLKDIKNDRFSFVKGEL